MTDDRPPVTGSRHVLPFERLSPDAFERLCLGLLRAEGFERVRHLGASGADGGIDLAAFDPEGRPVAIQCKRYEKLGPAAAEEAVRKLLARPWDPPAERLYLLVSTTVSRDAEERARAASGGRTLEVWALTELDARVNDHPELLERFFQIGADGSITVKAGDGGVAAGGDARFEARDHGIVATGNVTIHAPSVREVAEAARIRCVPPAPPPEFTGREEDIAEITRQLVGGENVGITAALQGMGGVGKTSLALKVAERLDRDHRDSLPGGVLWSNVGPGPDVLGILDGWAAQAGASLDFGRFPTAEARAPLVRQALTRLDRLCVVLDDVWTAETAKLLLDVVPAGCPRLVTTRKVEVARALHCKPRRLDALPPADAIALLERLVGPLGPHRASAERIVTLIEGLPLAIEIVAGQADDPADLPALASALEKRPRLEILSLGREHRDESVEACLALSYHDLEAADQRRFRALGILAEAPFDEGFLAAIWDEEPLDEVALRRLLRRSLLRREPQAGLLRQHALLHAHAAALLDRDGEVEAVRERLVDYCQVFVRSEGWARVELQYEQIRRGWELASESTAERRASYALAAVRFQMLRGRSRDRLSWLEAAVAAPDLPPTKRGVLLHELAFVYSTLGRKDEALKRNKEALAVFSEVGDRANEGVTLSNTAAVFSALGRNDEALKRYEEALTVIREVGNRAIEGSTLNNIAKVHSDLGRHDEALKGYEEALAVIREVGNRAIEGTTLNNIATAHAELGRRGEALKRFEEALAVIREVGDQWGEAVTLFNLGRYLGSLDRLDEAIAALEAAVALDEKVGHPDLDSDRAVLESVRAERDARAL